MKEIAVALLLCCLAFSVISAESDSDVISKQEFKQWFKELSNWGRWGEKDELGTLNLITPEVKIKAAALVKRGVSISLGLDLNTEKSGFNTHPFEHDVTAHAFGDQSILSDKYSVEYHGAAHTHIDALSHIVNEGKAYNGFSADSVKPSVSGKLGIHNMKGGVVSRGVLVDVPLLRGVEFLEPGDAITVADLEAWEKKTGIIVRAGDVLLVRVGRWERDKKHGPGHLINGAAGLHASVVPWLKQRDVAVLGSDGGNDVIPSGVEDMQFPVHLLALVSLGMPLLDNLDLDVLAAEAVRQQRWEFLFMGAPLRARGGTGSPLNPLAMF